MTKEDRAKQIMPLSEPGNIQETARWFERGRESPHKSTKEENKEKYRAKQINTILKAKHHAFPQASGAK